MSPREMIIGRIKEALKVLAPRPHAVSGQSSSKAGPRAWLPAVPCDLSGQIQLFRKNSDDLQTKFEVVQDEAEAIARLQELQISEGWDQLATHREPLVESVAARLNLPTLFVDDRPAAVVLEKCPVSITRCDALVAQTGSILLTSRSAGGRALSVLPPHHVVIARRDDMLPDLPAAFDLLHKRYGASYPSFCTFITGPSRTGDIERILVLGAHGPRKLTVILIDQKTS